MHADLPEEIEKAIMDEFSKLDCQYVAVRSSATSEDSLDAAWAGQLDTYLNTTQEYLIENVRKCWASLFTSRALFYRFSQKLDSEKISVAVVVQKMVDSEVSGVAFSVHPVLQDHNLVIIEAGFGLGEAIVSGHITPDSYIVKKDSHEICEKQINSQSKGLFRNVDGGNIWSEIDVEMKTSQKLNDIQILLLSEQIKKIELFYNFPCDIEWALYKDRIFILQSRPITTLEHQSTDSRDFLKLGKWVSPVLEYEAWIDWSHSIEAQELGFTGDYLMSLNGNLMSLSDGVYSQVKAFVLKEFENRKFTLSNKLVECAYKLIKQCDRLSEGLSKDSDFNSLVEAFDLIKRLRFPWLACIAFDESADKYLKGYCQNNQLNFDEIASNIPVLENTLTKDTKQLKKFKKHIENFDYKYDFDDIKKSDEQFAAQILDYQQKTEFFGTHHFWGDPRLMPVLMDEIENFAQVTKLHYQVAPNDLSEIVDLISRITHARIESAKSSARLAYKFRVGMAREAKKFNLDYEDIIFLTLDEVQSLDAQNCSSALELIDERKKGFGMLVENNEIKVITGDQLQSKMIEYNLIKNFEGVSNLKGNVGCKGYTKGKVAIVLTPHDLGKVTEGMILVAPETTPDFLPAMHKASAFVTDLGGVTSHAAIVAREMNKPCVIGTTDATAFLKDGDIVEVDAINGVVRKCQRL